ncbi:MAG: hypothetical protein SVM86_01800 [Candidatus Cloacimonadota bacterium]|nr:hypothetical protein [Candidatus Cloacimonadota bacterium]
MLKVKFEQMNSVPIINLASRFAGLGAKIYFEQYYHYNVNIFCMEVGRFAL